MSENNRKEFWTVKTMVFLALLVALHIVLTRVFVIELGGVYRITLGNVCTVLAGLWFGPIAGGVCGLTSDLLGCLMRGYAINPLITLAAMGWGILPALARPLLAGRDRKTKTAIISSFIVLTAIVSTLVLTTAGLVLFNGANFYAIFPGRVVQCLIMTPIYCVVTCLLYFSPLTMLVSADAIPGRIAKKTV